MKGIQKTLCCTIASMAAIFSGCHSNNFEANHENISYEGRVDLSNANIVRFSFPGVTIRANFQGKAITARFRDFANAKEGMHNTFYCIIDGGEPQKIVLNETQYDYLLAKNLDPDTIHSVELFKLTESLVGEVGFCGFYIEGENGKLVEPDTLPSLKMEFVGNSISCGYGNELSSVTPKAGFSPLNENNYYAWGAVAARALNARYVCTAYSGKGVCRNYEGDCSNTIPQFYGHTLANNHEVAWNYSDYVPDILVLNIGTNDFGAETTTNVRVDSVKFIAEYNAFLTRVRSYYPDAKIICSVGPMTNDENLDNAMQLTRYSEYVLLAVKNAGGEENNVFYFETAPQTPPFGEDYHPTKETHQRMANELVDFILEKNLIKK